MKISKTALGRAGVAVSRLCFGALTMGPLQKDLPVHEAAALIRRALALGINFYDTAQLYGVYPHLRAGLGNADAVIATKTYAYTAEDAVAALEEARRELNRDVIDIFLLHEQESMATLTGHRPALDALYAAKAAGRVRAVGLSTHHIAGVYAAVSMQLDVVHPIYNLTGIGIADGSAGDMTTAIQTAQTAGLGVYAMKSLGGGHLRGRAAEALDFVLAHPGIDSVAVGMATAAELDSNAHYFEHGTFPPAYREVEKQPRRLMIDEDCSGCGDCLPACRSGALAVRDGKAVCAPERCRLCGYCAALCKNFFIKNT